MSLIELAKWLPNYIKAFGLISGTSLFLRVAWLSLIDSRTAQPVTVPGLNRPVWLRPRLKDLRILQQIHVKREYDACAWTQFAHVRALYQDMVARNEKPLIIDCGAHVGLSVLWFRQVFPAAQIFAVEPNPENFAMLERNLAGLENVSLFHGGIWNTPGRLRLSDAQGGMAGFRLVSASPSESGDVAVTTIPQIFERAGVPRALLVKIDIEGGEAELFRDHADWLDAVEMLVIELHDWLYPWQGSSDSFFRQVSRRRFDYLFRGENLFCFRRPLPAETQEEPGSPVP